MLLWCDWLKCDDRGWNDWDEMMNEWKKERRVDDVDHYYCYCCDWLLWTIECCVLCNGCSELMVEVRKRGRCGLVWVDFGVVLLWLNAWCWMLVLFCCDVIEWFDMIPWSKLILFWRDDWPTACLDGVGNGEGGDTNEEIWRWVCVMCYEEGVVDGVVVRGGVVVDLLLMMLLVWYADNWFW